MDSRNFLGIELGSTRIKAVLIDEKHEVITAASHHWENQLEEGHWTYHLDGVWAGLQDCMRQIITHSEFRIPNCIGVSAMMHGYLAFDGAGRQLTAFRTWRNTTTGQASGELSALFGFRVPQRWSVAHLYQAMLHREPHVKDAAFLTTLAGYVHWRLTGEKVLGVGDASGMFPVDEAGNYNADMLAKFQSLTQCDLKTLLPAVLTAGEPAGVLTQEGARLLDPTGTLPAGIPFCPPEGDAGTGMVATNSVGAGAGNVSAGTSIFAMAVLDKAPAHALAGIDMVTTPAGKPVAMVHCNNCTSDIDAFAGLFRQGLGLFHTRVPAADIYDTLYAAALEGEADCGGVLSYNFFAGEPIAGIEKGCPLLCRGPAARLTPANLMRSLVFSAVAGLRLGLDILAKEQIRLQKITGHGGFFKSGAAGQRLLAAALDVPVTVMRSAGEGGAYGMALLAAYKEQNDGETLEEYLSTKVFAGAACTTIQPDEADRQGFERYFERYKAGLGAVNAAGKAFGE